MNDKMRPALIGGVALGLLSAIPFINIVNACCCAWAIAGGVLAAHLYVKGSSAPARPADGAVVGALAGAIGAAIYLIVGVPLGLVMGNTMMRMLAGMMQNANPEQAAAMEQMMAAGVSVGSAIINAIFVGVLLIIFATVGGLIGVAIFEKRKGGAAPPPPGFGGPAAGGFGDQGGGYGAPGGGGGSTGGSTGGTYGQGS